MKEFGSLGGRDDVYIPEEVPEVDRWRPVDTFYHEPEDIGEADEFPTKGQFFRAEELATGRQIYVAATEGLERMMEEWMEEREELLEPTELTVDVDTAEKHEGERYESWRYTGSIVHADEVGPPEDSE